jgi:hypothetical protein
MAAGRQWSDLGERTRRLLVSAAIAEGVLKIAALVDLKRRPASQVRGPMWLWATVVTVVSSAGVVPVSYFVFGGGGGILDRRPTEIVAAPDHGRWGDRCGWWPVLTAGG